LSGERVERRLAAILAADVVGYSRLMGLDEAGTLRRVRDHRRELIDPEIAEHKGRIVKTTGDGILIEFPSVVEAVACAVAVQRGMAERNADTAEQQRIVFRVGVNLGDIIVDGDDIHGDGVNVAARLEGIAEPGGICVSAIVHDQVRDKLDLIFDDMGEQTLKNIARPLRVYRVRLASETAPTASSVEATPTLALPDKPSIAVLPFQNMSGDPEQEYFADGMVEEITTALSRIHWLFVIARNSSFAYKGKSPDLRQVGRELGVRYVLEGSVRRAGNRVRITGQLVDTTTGAHIWADRFDGVLDDIFELQDQVASSVAGAIEPRLRQSEIERVSRKPTNSLDAYDLYLRAVALRDQHTDESVHDAIALLKRALAIDPTYAPAAALIGWSLVHRASHGRIPISQSEAAEAVTLARQALETGKDDPDALWMAAFTLFFLVGEHAIAATAIDRALTLNPNSAHAWMARGYVFSGRGQPALAIEALEHAMRLNPLDRLGRAFTNGIAIAHLVAGRYDEALNWANRTLHEDPGYSGALRTMAVACAQLDRIDEAREAVHQMIEAQPWYTIAWARLFYSRLYPPEIAEICVDALRKAGLPEE
jgi:TolB-like protein/class 3 adenylate cyclase